MAAKRIRLSRLFLSAAVGEIEKEKGNSAARICRKLHDLFTD
jgi:hypothetical protein